MIDRSSKPMRDLVDDCDEYFVLFDVNCCNSSDLNCILEKWKENETRIEFENEKKPCIDCE